MKRTPLYDEHLALGARMVEFGGWEMPVWYSGIPTEHQSVRTGVGLFDVSHMGQFKVQGPMAEAFLRRTLTNDVAELADGQAHYSLIPNEEGGTVDDLLVYRLAPEHYLLVVNAGNIDKDFQSLKAEVRPSEANTLSLTDQSADHALLALQGPRAEAVMARLTDTDVSEAALPYYHFVAGEVGGHEALISRTGYTGEDGFELMVPAEDAAPLWRAVLSAGYADGIKPAGLGARDSLRLEAAMPLYGHELDDSTSALEAGLARFVKLEKAEQVGLDPLRRQKADGVKKRLVGFKLQERGIPRQGMIIQAAGEAVGVVTSGTLSPALDEPIGLGYVRPDLAKAGQALAIEMRGRAVPAVVVKRPFYVRPTA